jgi:hypothetical protein
VKWKLMTATLPWVGAAVAAKLTATHVLGQPGVVDFADVGLVLSGGVFLLGFMLAGTLADFKEAEKLPGELACTLETIEETLVQATVQQRGLDPAALRRAVLETAGAIEAWVYRTISHEQAFESVGALSEAARSLERAGATSYAARTLAEVHNLRKLVTRMGVISRTGFIAAGYALLEAMATAVFGVLLISRFKSPLAEGLITAFVTLIFVYMIKLIRDIDDPFEYTDTGAQGGAAEVELFPLREYRARLEARIRAAAGTPAPSDASVSATTPAATDPSARERREARRAAASEERGGGGGGPEVGADSGTSALVG